MPFTFRDRTAAGAALAQHLLAYQTAQPLILAIPRGGVPVAQPVSHLLSGELDVVLAHKLGAPWQEELGVGAVDEYGNVYVSEYAQAAGATDAYLEQEKARQLAMLQQRRSRYTAARTPSNPAGRCVIVVDDGIATGATMIAALAAVRSQQPDRLIAAVPVAPPSSLAEIAPYADSVVCIATPANFYAVGQFYDEFPAVSDDEVMAILWQESARR